MENKHVKRSLFVIQIIIFTIHSVSSYHIDGVTVTQSDHQALIAIKHELIDLNRVLSSWKSNNNTSNGACSGGWEGIKCVQGHVIAIQLPWKGLSGRISEKIGLLKSLRKVSLHDNALTGPVPTSLGFIPNLRGVYLFNNRLSGSIPPSIGNCLLLQTLDVSNNLLIGTVPSSLVNSENVYRLNLSFNSLSGSIPIKFSQSNSLQFLDLQHNNISGPVPDSWDNSYQLQLLTLNHNLLTGTFPIGLSNLSSLETLNLNHNKFTGQIPAITNQFSNISHLDLSENGFTGEISDSFSNLKNLNFFNVSYNNLSGPVPQLLTKKFNSSSFIGNLQLCGYVNSSPCPSTNLTTSPFSTPHHHKRKLSTKDIILIASGILLLMLLLICCILLCCLIRKRTASKQSNLGDKKTVVPTSATRAADIESGGETGGRLVHFEGPFMFTADDLLCATAEIMGKSPYGTAYKATLEDGDHVAVKRLREKTTKGQKEFEVEVSALGKIRHPNILALRAYYLGPKGEKLLVFDYMTRGSLASFLHARGPETAINWTIRMNIATGITRGLHYLHKQEDIIHENLTSSNILLDEQSNPHIADVGLSKLMTASANTNMIATSGSTGYRAPELSKLRKANDKSDVYSLGVIILELLTGKSPSEGMNGVDLPQWVASIVKEEWTNEVFDLELMKYGDESGSNDELLNTLRLALHCVDPSPEARPDVQQVLQQLEEIKMDLTEEKTTAGEA